MFETLNFVSLTCGLLLQSPGLVLLIDHHFHVFVPLSVLLSLQLFQELLVSHKDTVGIALFLGLSGEQFC